MHNTTRLLYLRIQPAPSETFDPCHPVARICANLPTTEAAENLSSIPDDCFITHECLSLEELEGEIERLKRKLDEIRDRACSCFGVAVRNPGKPTQ
jgi:hypothetical protein